MKNYAILELESHSEKPKASAKAFLIAFFSPSFCAESKTEVDNLIFDLLVKIGAPNPQRQIDDGSRGSRSRSAKARNSRCVAADELLHALRPLADGLTLTQLIVLLAIAANPRLSVNELAEKTGLSQTVVSRTTVGMTARPGSAGGAPRQFVEKSVHEANPRMRSLELTSEAKALIETTLSRLSQ